MNFEYINFDGTNNDIIEIVSSFSALGLLKRSGNENIKICLPLSLCIGKFDSYIPFNRKVLSQYYKNENYYDFTDDFNKLKEFVNNCSKIRVWSSHLDSDDYCLLLLICYLFKDKEISAIFSEELNWGATTISAINEKEISELEKREHILTKWQKEDYCNEWKKIINDNKELRYMINGTVVSCNVDKFDEDIIDRLEKAGKIYIFKLVADLIGNPPTPYVIYSDYIYIYLIERLEKKGLIKSSIIDNKKYIELNNRFDKKKNND